MQICIVGLGKIGLPLALQVAGRGHDAIGLDVNSELIDMVNAGLEPFPGEPGLAERLSTAIERGNLRATTNAADAMAGTSATIVVVPLIVDHDKKPDFSSLDAATVSIASHIEPGTLVSYETTLPVGTTRDRFTPALVEISGLVPGSDLFVCFSPERVSSGRVFADLARYPKIVGGIDQPSAERATSFYRQILDFDDRADLGRPNGVWDMGSAEAAEFVKLAETTYRDVNIALANEFAVFADRSGMDVFKVIEAANSQPFSHIHQPGIAVGGHCIPVYPHLYLATDPTASLPAVSRQVNSAMPAHAVDLLTQMAGDLRGLSVVVLGVAFRRGVKESAFSGVFGTVDALMAAGALVSVHDPMFTDEEIKALSLHPFVEGSSIDAAIVQTDHLDYADWGQRDLPGVRWIVDGRRVIDRDRWAETGVEIRTLGVGRTS